jgi:cytoplasmic iron level regulating protein YaaA (DUF328/UPF0246 family)
MILLLSPAKTLDLKTESPIDWHTELLFPEQADLLASRLGKKRKSEIQKLMNINDKLTQLNYDRYQNWTFPYDPESQKQAIFSFSGDVYRGLKATSLDERDIKWAQDHLRILSGLYGILRPLDGMYPYRLEMGTKLKVGRKNNLYQYWGNQLADQLNAEMAEREDQLVVNLASNEYFKAVDAKALNASVVTPEFRDWNRGEYRMIQMFVKYARGLMARYLIQKRAAVVEDLRSFDLEGYRYSEEMSSPEKPVFIRDKNS